MDRAVLDASGAVCSAFIDDVTALCGDCDGDAEALVVEERELWGFRAGDVNLVMGFFLVTGLLAVVFNLIADLLYSALDPRIRVN